MLYCPFFMKMPLLEVYTRSSERASICVGSRTLPEESIWPSVIVAGSSSSSFSRTGVPSSLKSIALVASPITLPKATLLTSCAVSLSWMGDAEVISVPGTA